VKRGADIQEFNEISNYKDLARDFLGNLMAMIFNLYPKVLY
jgi:hypothetical protein